MKPTMNRLLARLAMFVVAIVLGAVAVHHAHKVLDENRKAKGSADTQLADASAQLQSPDQSFAAPIPIDVANTADAPTYGTSYDDAAPDPGFDQEQVSYQDTPAYQAAVEQPPAPMQESYGQPYDAAPAYGDDTYAQQPGDYDDAPAYDQQLSAPPVQMTAGQGDQGQYEYAYQPESTPGGDYGQAAADTYEAQPAQYTAATTAGDSGFSQPEPMTMSPPDPGYLPAETATHGEPGYDSQQPPYGQGYGDEPGSGTASVSIGEPRTRSAPDYNTTSVPNPAFADVASSQPFQTPGGNYADAGSYSGSVSGATGNGKPGPRELEGAQTPSLTVSKSSPPEVQVGKPAIFTVTVSNVGSVAAHDVLIRDEVPHGARLLDTSPTASQAADGALLWEMGTIEAGSQVSVTMEVMPMEEGEIGSVATVSFQTSASSKSVSTRPQLVLEHSTEREVLVGEDVIFQIKLTNAGTGAATGVRVEEDVPDGLRHFEGRELEFEIGTLRPQESRLLELKLKADQPRPVTNVLVARADGDIVVSDQVDLDVVAPGLQVAIEGPRRRYLERRATHIIALANPGTAAARNVSLVARLPRGLKFVNTNNAGQYDSSAHAVRWSLDELPAREMGKVELTTTPTEMGEHRIQVSTQADMGLEASADHEIFVDGLAALLFTVTDVSDPIEVGGETTYEVHVVNQGSKTATNLRLMAAIPPGMQAINGEGPTRAVIDGQRVVFDPLARLAPQSDSFYKIHVKGIVAGDQRIKVLLTSDEVRDPVTKEESTHVYADE